MTPVALPATRSRQLALAALALVAGQLTIAAAGGYLGYSSGLSTALAVPTILTILIAPQIALVAGSLAALRALRRRQSRRLPAGEGRDVQPRVLLSGMRVLAG